MDAGTMLREIGVGSSFLLSSLGSVIGTFIVGSAAIGAWKKCYIQNKPAPFVLVAYGGAPLTNIIYGYILMTQLMAATNLSDFQLFYFGALAGIVIGISAYTQARVAAYACESFAETGQGFGNNIMMVGLCETIALFTMVFTILVA